MGGQNRYPGPDTHCWYCRSGQHKLCLQLFCKCIHKRKRESK